MKIRACIVITAAITTCLAGCQATKWGTTGEQFEVFFFTKPPNAPIYLIPNKKWEAKQDELLAAGPKDLKNYSLGNSPRSKVLTSRTAVLTRDPAGNNYFDVFEPADVQSVTIDFGPPATTQESRRE